MTGIEGFDDVRELEEGELRELLEHGRPEERVWAIWALAMRSAGHVGELARHHDPDPGVRRNLAIVLAGHGELELLVALAHRDPAPEVRAGAMQLVTRLALDGKLAAELVAGRVRAEAAEVKIAVLGTMFSGAPRWLVELAVQLLDDRDGDVRYEAFEALVRAGELAPAMMWLEESPESEARLALMRWSARGRVRPCAELLAGSSRRLRRLLIESVRVATWAELAPAIDDDPGLVRVLARRNAAAFDEMPVEVLLRATLREPSDAWVLMIRDRLAALGETGASDELAALLHDYRDLCAQRIAELDRRLGELRGTRGAGSGQLGAIHDERIGLELALEAASRLLVH